MCQDVERTSSPADFVSFMDDLRLFYTPDPRIGIHGGEREALR
jgi:hypothetical protein